MIMIHLQLRWIMVFIKIPACFLCLKNENFFLLKIKRR